MAEINIITELAQADRERLDVLASGLAQLSKQLYGLQALLQTAGTPYAAPAAAEQPEEPTEAPQEPQAKPKRQRKAKTDTTPAPEEKPAETAASEPTEAAEPEPQQTAEPRHTVEELKGYVIKLLAEKPTLAAPLQSMVREYAPKISAIPADKVDEVWSRAEGLANG